MAVEYFTKDHEYIRIEADVGTVGITNHAQEQLGDVVFVEVPEVGKKVKAGDQTAVVESVKAASEIYAPVSGEVIAANADLAADPALVNQDPMGRAWFLKIRLTDTSELDTLMDKAAYDRFVAESH
jgi:glycine cleavage system H protein